MLITVLLATLGLVIVISLLPVPATPAQAQRFYLRHGKVACYEALVLVSPVLKEEDRKRIETRIANIGTSQVEETPLSIMGDLSVLLRSQKISPEEKQCFQDLYAAVGTAAYLPFGDQLAVGEEEKARTRKSFPSDFKKTREKMEGALEASRKLRN